MSSPTKEELKQIKDDFIDWYFLGEYYRLEDKGYEFAFFGNDLDKSMTGTLGSYVLVTGEFPHGDVVFTQKVPDTSKLRELGLVPVSASTEEETAIASILEQVGESEVPIELYSPGLKWAGVVHPCTRPYCAFQGSMIDSRGPVGHVEADSFEDALRRLFEHTRDWHLSPGIADTLTMAAVSGGRFKHPKQNPPESKEELIASINEDLGVVVVLTNYSEDAVTLDLIQAREKKQGLGSEAMRRIVEWADENNKTIALTPETSFGASSVARLKKFYKRFGFVENKGRNKDYSYMQSMYRNPKV